MRSTMRLLSGALLLATTALPALAQERQSGDTFNWSGRIPTGRWIHVQNLNGSISVAAASGSNVEVTATKHWRRGDPAVVHFLTEKGGQGDEDVTICAVWGDRTSCNDRGGDRRDRRMRDNNDVSVEFKVLVPKGVKVGVGTVNGGVSVDDVSSEVEASTVNGEVNVATSGGPVNAHTVNGNVRARMGRVDSNADMEFNTVNGSVIVEFTGDFGGDIELSTVNGSLNTKFERTGSGRLDPKHVRAHIGKPGGPTIKLSTVNGSVELRKR